ncbi:hypothetical protein WOLCODRAFT_139136 [Wolfiporia cocos MD-104 SS10]|uniref:BZIP domain-containing protein n=1 Tax=Wolfiporia cocos (strain MD-104) TaxID=742152 RepID=A0A2H3JXG1_WOLCO|nr:hypothetical protein WOLCODRAFT_139136 [Wolfiporia cocos MD-104 SS10]
MLVDNPIPSGFALNSAFEDFFNMEFFAGPSNAATSTTGGSPRSDASPSNSFSTLPPTPPNAFLPDTAMDTTMSQFLDFPLDDDFSKLDLPAPLAAPGFDFLGAFSAASATEISSPDSGSSASAPASALGESPSSIDPQLVTTPSSAQQSLSDAGDLEENEDDDDEEEEHDDGASVAEAYDHEMGIVPVKVGGRGKANRRGTVQSGGVVKRAGSEKKENKPSNMLSTTSAEPDDWRPSPEEYKKMTSKEKRQLRNKISARNFRVRRKEYINTLEGDIAERDRLIDAIRTELGSTKSENIALRQEITALKKALLEGRGRPDTPILPPPAPLPAVPASVLAAGANSNSASTPAPPKSPLLTPNTQKDMPISPRMGGRGFWGGAASAGLGFGGFTPVHTTLVPELGSMLSGKPLAGPVNGRRSPSLQENINPMLNGASDKSKEQQPQQPQQLGSLDAFMDMNPFSMKTLDPYRMQLWRNMAAQQHYRQHQAQQQQSNASPSPSPLSSPSGLASGLRPHYFAKQGPVLSSLLSGKSAAGAYPTPPNSPPLAASLPSSSSSVGNKGSQTPTPQQAMLATMASQTLVRKLGSAFWDAFSARPSGAAGSRRAQELDAEKVRRVIEGSAVLRVVDVEPQAQATQRITTPQQSPVLRPIQAQSQSSERKCNITDLLEESMRTLSLGKK